MDNQLQVFTNEEFGSVRIRVDAEQNIEINLEDAARGLGFTTIATSGNVVARWNRVKKYLADFGFTAAIQALRWTKKIDKKKKAIIITFKGGIAYECKS